MNPIWGRKMTSQPEGLWDKMSPLPEGVDIIFHEPKGMGWHFAIINRQAGLLMYFKMLWVSYAKTI